jgi:glycosyltransferase involved in cell wall biosynthesis
MLSILIPIYAFDVRPLVGELHRQCEVVGLAYEIVCFDDGSPESFRRLNREIDGLSHVIYREMPQNLGRSGIRNRLAEAAQYDYLIFMDCDSGVVRDDYIRFYAVALRPDTLLYGGRVYAETPPADPGLYLHWLYGSKREQIQARVRQRTPYHAFMTNNFLIPRDIFLQIRFDERLRQYGHEDTLFGRQLEKRGVPIVHFHNPLEHLGLEPAPVFLEKSARAIENLAFLLQAGEPVETKLTVVYNWLEKKGLAGMVARLGAPLLPLLRRQLLSRRPSLGLFDMMKLLLLCQGMRGRE